MEKTKRSEERIPKKRKQTKEERNAKKRKKEAPTLNLNELICGGEVSTCPVKLFEIVEDDLKLTEEKKEKVQTKNENPLLIFFIFKCNDYINIKAK